MHANVFKPLSQDKKAFTAYKAFGCLCIICDNPVHQRLLRRIKVNFGGIRYTNVFQAYKHSAPAASPPERSSEEGQNCGPSVYKISCENVKLHVGVTEHSLKARFGEHRRPTSTTSEVLKHIHTDSPNHTIKLENAKILAVEHKWFERGVKEAIHIRALKPSLSRDGGRYNLPPIWNNIIKERLMESVTGTINGGGACPSLRNSVGVLGRP